MDKRPDRLFAIHGYLLALAMGLAAQEADWSWTFALPACTLANLLLWLLITRRASGAPSPWTILRRTPLLLLLPSLYFVGLFCRFSWQPNASVLTVALPTLCFAANFVIAAFIYASAPRADGLLYGLAATGALICVEGLAHEWVKTHGFIDLITRSPYRRDIAADQITRLGYPIAYPNALATVLLFFSACTLGAIVSTRRLPVRALLVMVLLLNFVCIVLTGSRGGLISVLFLPMAFVGRQVRSGRWIATASATLVVAAVAWMLRKPYARLRGSGSLLQRAHGWVVTLKITTRSPWFGEGPDAFSREWASYGPAHGYSNQFGLDGFYPNLMCQGGVVSLTVLSTLIIAAGREVKRLLYSRVPESAQNALYYLSVGLGVVLIHNIVETTLSSRPIILGASLLFGVVTGLRHREQETRVPIAASVEWTGGTYSSGPRRQPA